MIWLMFLNRFILSEERKKDAAAVYMRRVKSRKLVFYFASGLVDGDVY